MRVLRISHSAVVDAWRERERRLAAAGVELYVLTAEVWNEGGVDVPLRPRPGEPVTPVATWGSHPALFVYDPRPIWRALGEAWDVIDVHEEPFALATAEVLALRWLRRAAAPYALYSAQNLAKRYPPPFRWFERAALRHAAGLSVCNTEAGQICVAKGFPGRPRVIPLGLDLAEFHPADSEEARQIAPDPVARGAGSERDPGSGQFEVGYAGRLSPHKGVAVLLEAVAGHRRLNLRVAGDGPQLAELQRRAEERGCADRVAWLGALQQRQLADFYRSMDVLAVPSLTTPSWVEQFGRVATEAMACGTPVVASRSGALPDVVGDAGLLVPPGDETALGNALLTVCTDSALRLRLRDAGLKRASECDWDVVAEDYLAMYSAMLREPAAGHGVEVIVVAFGAPGLLRRALEPVRSLPVTVVDNSSRPEIRAICAGFGVRYVDPGRNSGFGAGVNIALGERLLPDADVLLLNPDAIISLDGLRALQGALRADPSLASVGPAQVDADGVSARAGWPFPSPARTWLEAVGLGRVGRQEAFAIGSVLLLRAEALDQVGGFDERFFLYAEETDWSYRASLLGWKHRIVEDVVAEHQGAGTSTDPELREAHFHASQERFLRKHYGVAGWGVARAGQVAGSLVRAVVLPGERGRLAAARARRYVRGPIRSEPRPA